MRASPEEAAGAYWAEVCVYPSMANQPACRHEKGRSDMKSETCSARAEGVPEPPDLNEFIRAASTRAASVRQARRPSPEARLEVARDGSVNAEGIENAPVLRARR
jgi:hypothetical protein